MGHVGMIYIPLKLGLVFSLPLFLRIRGKSMNLSREPGTAASFLSSGSGELRSSSYLASYEHPHDPPSVSKPRTVSVSFPRLFELQNPITSSTGLFLQTPKAFEGVVLAERKRREEVEPKKFEDRDDQRSWGLRQGQGVHRAHPQADLSPCALNHGRTGQDTRVAFRQASSAYDIRRHRHRRIYTHSY